MNTPEIEQVRSYIALYEEAARSLPRQTVRALKTVRAAELRRRHVTRMPGPVPAKKADLAASILAMQFPSITEARARLAELEGQES